MSLKKNNKKNRRNTNNKNNKKSKRLPTGKREDNWRLSLKNQYKEVWDFIKNSQIYIYSVIAIFAFFLLLGGFAPVPEQVSNIIVEYLKEIREMTEGMSGGELTGFIFQNNLKVSLLSIFLGIIGGVFPVLMSIVNGYIVGFVAERSVEISGVASLWRLAPHGVFELPAIFLAFGVGLRFGSSFIKRSFEEYLPKEKRNSQIFVGVLTALSIFILSIFSMFFLPVIVFLLIIFLGLANKSFGEKLKKDFKYNLINSLRAILLLIIPLLALAAVIEGILIILI